MRSLLVLLLCVALAGCSTPALATRAPYLEQYLALLEQAAGEWADCDGVTLADLDLDSVPELVLVRGQLQSEAFVFVPGSRQPAGNLLYGRLVLMRDTENNALEWICDSSGAGDGVWDCLQRWTLADGVAREEELLYGYWSEDWENEYYVGGDPADQKAYWAAVRAFALAYVPVDAVRPTYWAASYGGLDAALRAAADEYEAPEEAE